ncbi:MAG: hypothetical protein EZS28_040505, partial [Streblomastix strix]
MEKEQMKKNIAQKFGASFDLDPLSRQNQNQTIPSPLFGQQGNRPTTQSQASSFKNQSGLPQVSYGLVSEPDDRRNPSPSNSSFSLIPSVQQQVATISPQTISNQQTPTHSAQSSGINLNFDSCSNKRDCSNGQLYVIDQQREISSSPLNYISEQRIDKVNVKEIKITHYDSQQGQNKSPRQISQTSPKQESGSNQLPRIQSLNRSQLTSISPRQFVQNASCGLPKMKNPDEVEPGLRFLQERNLRTFDYLTYTDYVYIQALKRNKKDPILLFNYGNFLFSYHQNWMKAQQVYKLARACQPSLILRFVLYCNTKEGGETENAGFNKNVQSGKRSEQKSITFENILAQAKQIHEAYIIAMKSLIMNVISPSINLQITLLRQYYREQREQKQIMKVQ